LAKSKIECPTEFSVNLSEITPARILHVDDEPNLLKVAKQCLEIEDTFHIDTATSVDEANKMMKKREYDVIVSDYMMPGKSGLDFLRELREDGENVPFIIFTGKGREEVAVKALNLGADQYLNKVGNPETVYSELAHGIRKAIERKRANTRIRESEERFRNIFENACDAMIYLDASGRILDVNHRTIEILGGSKKELVGKRFTNVEVFSPSNISELKKPFEEGLAGKHTVVNIDITNMKGQRISLECHSSQLKIFDETTLLIIGRDVTQRRQAEEGLRKSEAKCKALLEDTPIGICNLDITGNITYVNKAFTQILGYSSAEVVGKSALNLARQSLQLPDEKLKSITDRIKNRLVGREKSQPMRLMLRRKDGDMRWVEAESKLIKRFKIPVGLQAIIKDITERKQSEEKLRESEERFRSIVENAHGGIGIVDNDFKIRYINNQVTHILGYSKKEIIGQDFRKFLPDDSRSPIQDRYLHRQNGEKAPSQYELELIRKNGEKITVEVKVAAIKSGQGQVQTIAEVLDITNRKKAYEALRESEEKFRNLAGQLPNMVFIIKNGRVVYVNKKCVEVIGYSEEEFYSSDFDLLSLTKQKSFDTVISASKNQMKDGEVTPCEYTLVTKGGKRIETVISPKLIKYDGEDAILEIVTDITERKEKERQIQENREKFEGLFVGNPEAAVYVNSDFHILDVNPCFIELFGYSLEEIKGKTLLDTIVPRNKTEEAKALDRKVKEGHVYHDTVRKRKDGALIPVSISAAPITVKEQMIGYVALYKDISQLKSMEKAVRGTMAKLVTMNEKLRVVGRLTRHDVRNKLSAVTGNVFLAKKELSEDQKRLDYLNEIESSVRQVEEIFEFAASYERLGLEELDYMNVEKILREAAKLLPDLSKIELINDCDELIVLADSLLRQLFYNLIDNSLNHGETVTKIRIYFKEVSEDRLELIYEDNGVGIPKSEKRKIFLEGYGKSTGYGLYMIKKICEVYGWVIQETGKYKRGAQFTITILRPDKSGRTRYKLNHH